MYNIYALIYHFKHHKRIAVKEIKQGFIWDTLSIYKWSKYVGERWMEFYINRKLAFF